MSDTESDEDLRRAIKLSLMTPELQRDVIVIEDDDDENDDDLDKPLTTSAETNANQTPPHPWGKTNQPIIDLPKPVQLLSKTEIKPATVAAGLLGLDRRKMEEERLARAARRQRGEEDVHMTTSLVRKRKASRSPIQSQDRARQEKETPGSVLNPLHTLSSNTELREPLDAASALIEEGTPKHLQSGNKVSENEKLPSQEPTTSAPDTCLGPADTAGTMAQNFLSRKGQSGALDISGIHYPDGIVKKTWALGYDRKGDDIKIEEVLQKSDLELAVLSSFQIDADCMYRSQTFSSLLCAFCELFNDLESILSRFHGLVGPYFNPQSHILTAKLIRDFEVQGLLASLMSRPRSCGSYKRTMNLK